MSHSQSITDVPEIEDSDSDALSGVMMSDSPDGEVSQGLGDGLSENGRAALDYASRGWPVFPIYEMEDRDGNWQCSCPKGAACDNPGKHPRTKEGFLDATTNEKIIRGWWGAFPASNVAIVTGEESGLVVLDGDGERGAKALRDAGFTETLLAQSGSGVGLHAFFQLPKGLDFPIKSSIKGQKHSPFPKESNIDVRANGGYILVAPSNHASGGRYKWLNY